MTNAAPSNPRVAIACGGTGGHLFPGMAVGRQLAARGCSVQLLVSPKDVDRQAVQNLTGMEVVTLPAVGLVKGGLAAFAAGFWRSYRMAKGSFNARRPQAALAMGGFTSAAPILAARRLGAHTFLHESNTIPGRANRWLSWIVDQAFVGFPVAVDQLHGKNVLVTGTPVRTEFVPRDPEGCRKALGLNPERPVVVVLGGSQGATGINKLIIGCLPHLVNNAPHWQWYHLTGVADLQQVQAAYAAHHFKAVVAPFSSQMELVLGAATAAVSRAGASSLAELAAMRIPAALIPYPAAADDHQVHNARAFAQSGAARFLTQGTASPESLLPLLREMVEDTEGREKMRASLGQWHRPQAAEDIAGAILRALGLEAQAQIQAGGQNSELSALSSEQSPPRPTESESHGRLRFA